MRRRLLCSLALATLVPGSALAGTAKPASSWAAPQIAVVTAQDLMGTTDPAQFRPDDPFTRADAATLVAGLTQRQPVAPASPTAPVTMAGLDQRLVSALGLGPAAVELNRGARAAGLGAPARFGNEVVARLLGLRTNHPAAQDDLELRPLDVATRAEAAFSAARILGFAGWEIPAVQAQADGFSLPVLTPWQQQILHVAVSLIGYPYVWGGTSEKAEAPFGVEARGGFDCSGFVWRIYKLQAYPDEGVLADTLRGRTTYQMSGEVPASERISLTDIQPADVLFFGAKGSKSKPSQIDHAGIYLGNGWLIHASGNGVALAPLTGWYQTRFAWARRPLAEAGLAAWPDPSIEG
jgi:cell wall-associated NlpC family hydrolase